MKTAIMRLPQLVAQTFWR